MADSELPNRLVERPPDTPDGGLAGVLHENRPALVRFLTRRLGNEAEAEDVLQDVWLKLSEKPPEKPIADALGYVFRACENAARDYRRSEARRHLREGDYAELGAGGEAEGGADHSPEQLAIDREALAAVEAKIAAMPERTREIFIAFRLGKVSQQDLSRTHGISISAIQKHLQRAYRAIVIETESEKVVAFDAGKVRP